MFKLKKHLEHYKRSKQKQTTNGTQKHCQQHMTLSQQNNHQNQADKKKKIAGQQTKTITPRQTNTQIRHTKQHSDHSTNKEKTKHVRHIP